MSSNLLIYNISILDKFEQLNKFKYQFKSYYIQNAQYQMIRQIYASKKNALKIQLVLILIIFTQMQGQSSFCKPRNSQKKIIESHSKLKDCRITRRMNKMYELYGKETQKKCAICLTELVRDIAYLPCSHTFCLDCILCWWSSHSTCPFCRQQFEYITDDTGKKKELKDFPKKNMFKVEKTLKCEECWADIGDEKMRICIECRCVYIHERCLLQFQSRFWKCQECLQNEEKQFMKKKPATKDQSFFRKIKTPTKSVMNYRSQNYSNISTSKLKKNNARS